MYGWLTSEDQDGFRRAAFDRVDRARCQRCCAGIASARRMPAFISGKAEGAAHVATRKCDGERRNQLQLVSNLNLRGKYPRDTSRAAQPGGTGEPIRATAV